MKVEKSRSKIIARASWIGIIGNGIMAVFKIGVGLWGNSLVLIGAGIDTVSDVVTSLVTLLTGRIIDRPPDEDHPYGHGRAETIATKLLSFIIFFAGAQLVLSTVQQLLSEQTRTVPSPLTMFVALGAIVGKIILALVKGRAGKKAESSMLIADAENMKMDVLISGAALLGIFFTIRLHMPIVDTLLGLAVGLWIMWVAYGIFMQTNVELMDGLEDRDVYREVCRAALLVEGVENPHKMRIRQMNTRYVIDMDIEVDGRLTVADGHRIAMEVQNRIHSEVKNVYDVHVHVEPVGNEEQRERFGLSQDYLK
ncbi:MAG: cation diffusion facilitator family transporter [Spirochaetaceae bacterium]|nr:cation diffusion facilitator family transporter [Spirochaetaceae bacterium]MCF7949955.1 cation diffusion facilitator family transporter [Spirochaetia bacterium]MCF7952088.1 cation diffusion facilitator family transporter [Spirochaetaceae bacterium]